MNIFGFIESPKRCYLAVGLSVGALCLFQSAIAGARPYGPDEFTSAPVLNKLREKLSLKPVAVTCEGQDASKSCAALEAFKKKAASGQSLRILHLGDSHIAADFISSAIRDKFQDKWGNAGRALTHIDQLWGYGGRRLKRKDSGWVRPRVVDRTGVGQRYGFFGLALVSKKKAASITYKILPEDRYVEVYYEAGPKKGNFEVLFNKKSLGLVKAKTDVSETLKARFELPQDESSKAKKRILKIRAKQRGVRLYGIGFYNGESGAELTSIGPVGADAKVYLQHEADSFSQALKHYEPDLVMLMVGGNDALKIRKKWTTFEKVADDHRNLVAKLRSSVPKAACLIWSPMDAGYGKKGKVRSKPLLDEMRKLQQELANELGCAFWDTLKAMGDVGSIKRWVKVGLMNKDLIHPRKKGADLLGYAFADSFVQTF